MQTLFHDVRYAFRQMRKSPVFSATAILVLSLGVCASVAIFAFVDAALLKPLPYPDSSRLVDVTESAEMFPRANLSYLDYLDWKKLNHSFRSLEVYNNGGYLLRTATGAEPITGMRVTAGFFRTLQVAPALGRDFLEGEDEPSAAKIVILTYSTWQKRYGGSRNVIGQTILLSDVAHTIVGVLPRSFQFAPAGDSELWVPYHHDDGCAKRRGCHSLYGVARLKDGVSIEAARAEMKGIARQLELEYPVDNRGQGASVEALSKVMVADVRPILLLLLGGAGLLLVIACANVSSLLLVRSESRKREIAVRGALGASRPRLIRQFVTEGFVLMAGGTILGLIAASGAMRILLHLISKDLLSNMPYLEGIGINLHVFAFAMLVGVIAAALFSLAPIMRLPLVKVREGLAEGGRGYAGTLWRRFGANLVVVELAVAVILLFGAGLLGKSFYRLLHVDVGFQPDHLATVTLNLSETKYSKDELIVPVVRRILERIGSVPGVQSVGLSTMLPVSYNGNTNWIRVVGHPYNGEHNEVNERSVSPAFFSTLHAKLLRGRYFTEADDASKPPVIMINQKLASKYLPGEDPIGKRIGDNQLSPKSIAEIVGVVEDVKDGSLDTEIWPAMYYPFNQSTDTYFSLVARTSQSEQSVLPALVAAIREVDPGIGTMNPTSMAARINESPSAYLHRSAAWLVGGFAFLALLLGVVGLYGVIAYSVSQRTREIGVRMALGAQRESVLQLIMKEAGGLAAAGIVTGLVCAVGVATLMRALLFGVQSWDVSTVAAVAVLLAISAMIASYLPARRAASVDPMEALRYE
ncbi:MAG TPA: ABC transporter permease [Candidatus Sulfotelmatobacter sp.]|nr:ABC transporter permease [Candidatus Sulfotelmatobacter sp.]